MCTSHYAQAFAILERMKPALQLDMYAGPCLHDLIHHIRIRVLQQHTRPYFSLRLEDMAESLGTNVDSLESEVVHLIRSGQINARVDSHHKVPVLLQHHQGSLICAVYCVHLFFLPACRLCGCVCVHQAAARGSPRTCDTCGLLGAFLRDALDVCFLRLCVMHEPCAQVLYRRSEDDHNASVASALRVADEYIANAHSMLLRTELLKCGLRPSVPADTRGFIGGGAGIRGPRGSSGPRDGGLAMPRRPRAA
jgi:hypothetical protein